MHVRKSPNQWGTPIEKEVRRRITVSIAAYAYEFCDESILSDAEFDKLCMQINPQMGTGHLTMDLFFQDEFDPSTGNWIHKHPECGRIGELYRKHFAPNQCEFI